MPEPFSVVQPLQGANFKKTSLLSRFYGTPQPVTPSSLEHSIRSLINHLLALQRQPPPATNPYPSFLPDSAQLQSFPSESPQLPSHQGRDPSFHPGLGQPPNFLPDSAQLHSFPSESPQLPSHQKWHPSINPNGGQPTSFPSDSAQLPSHEGRDPSSQQDLGQPPSFCPAEPSFPAGVGGSRTDPENVVAGRGQPGRLEPAGGGAAAENGHGKVGEVRGSSSFMSQEAHCCRGTYPKAKP